MTPPPAATGTVWFLTGSQGLYGPEVVEQVEQQSRQIASLAIKHRLPSIHGTTEYPEDGGFMGYGQNIGENFRSAAIFVDKILKGARPAELPFEQPMRLELVINRKTAKAIGLAIPQELLLRADRVIE